MVFKNGILGYRQDFSKEIEAVKASGKKFESIWKSIPSMRNMTTTRTGRALYPKLEGVTMIHKWKAMQEGNCISVAIMPLDDAIFIDRAKEMGYRVVPNSAEVLKKLITDVLNKYNYSVGPYDLEYCYVGDCVCARLYTTWSLEKTIIDQLEQEASARGISDGVFIANFSREDTSRGYKRRYIGVYMVK